MTRCCRALLAASVLLAVSELGAGAGAWAPSPGHTELAIWPGAAPDGRPGSGPVDDARTTSSDELVAGRPWTYVGNVVRPTMTVYSPKSGNTGVAVVVFPGGGYTILAIDLEGAEVCDWLTSKGITCVLSKYRVPGLGFYPPPAPYPKSGPYPFSPMALEDAQRTLGLVRSHAAQWHVDPHKIGVLGFSAGGHLVAALSTHFDRRLYPAVDAADRESCRPDFAIALYPGHLTIRAVRQDAALAREPADEKHRQPAGRDPGLNPEVPVDGRTPPTFLLQSTDDPVDSVENSLVYYAALREAKVPVEMHLFARGGHAFGLRRTKAAVTAWPELVERWLRTVGVMPDPT